MKAKPTRKLIKPSTWSFIEEARNTNEYSFFDFLHGYVYLRWPYLYIGIGTGEHPLAKTLKPIANLVANIFRYLPSDNGDELTASETDKVKFADTYHGKVISLESAKQLVTVNEDISLPDLEHVIPYKRAKDIVMQDPDHILALRCPCRASRTDPCSPLDVCLIIGEPFASFVIEHNPDKARWINPSEAEDILQSERARGHVHHAFFKDAMLGRFYAICNCCSCCCGAMQAHRNGTPMLASSGYLASVESEICIGCSTCEDNCQFGAIQVQGDFAVVDCEACMGCGICVERCEQGALSLYRDYAKSEPLVLSEFMPLNDRSNLESQRLLS